MVAVRDRKARVTRLATIAALFFFRNERFRRQYLDPSGLEGYPLTQDDAPHIQGATSE